MKKRAVTILLHNEDGDILGVSRKNDPNDVGLPGGKVDDGETDEEAIIREVKEETGLSIFEVRPYFEREDEEYICNTFIGNYIGEITTTEKGKVVWTDWKTIQAGSFGEYNKNLEKHFNETLKFSQDDVVMNVETGEAFKIAHLADHGPDEMGYFVRAFCSEIGNSFVKKSAIDNIKMQFLPKIPTEDYLRNIGVTDSDTNDARSFACTSHFDANQYYDNLYLYSYHLRKTVEVGRKFKSEIPEEDWKHVEAGLWNHDNIEDARKTFNDLANAIGRDAAIISFALTNSDGKTRAERADDKYYQKIKNTRYATFAKLCDRIANLEYSLKTGSSMFGKYKKEHEGFKKKLYVVAEYDVMWDYIENLFSNN